MRETDLKSLSSELARQLIDIGAKCQRARCFSVAKPGQPIVSAYDFYAELVEKKLRDLLRRAQDDRG